MSKVLVTGATGFVGSALVRALLKHGEEVHILVRQKGPDYPNLEGLPLHAHHGDIQSVESLRNAMRGVDIVYHAAAVYQFYPWWRKKEPAIYKINVQGTQNILSCAEALGIKKLVYTSSIITIGKNPRNHLSNEETPFSEEQLVSHYARSKYEAEALVLAAARKGFPAVVVNPGVVVGARDHKPTPSGEIIVKFLNRRYPAYFDADWCFADVDDVAMGHILACQKGRVGERYILCNAQSSSMDEIFKWLEKISGVPRPRVKLPFPLIQAIAYADEWSAQFIKHKSLMPTEGLEFCKSGLRCDNAKAVRELGYAPTPIEVSLEKAVTWYRENGYVRS